MTQTVGRSRSRARLAVLALALLGGAVSYVARAERPASTPIVSTADRSVVLAPLPSTSQAVRTVVIAERSTESMEISLMNKLHELGETAPAMSLSLALEGNARFPSGSGAPERGWIICRSLVSMRRFDEAVAEARLVVERYPRTPWALDVEQHLLINPMSDPSERGYGKRYELE